MTDPPTTGNNPPAAGKRSCEIYKSTSLLGADDGSRPRVTTGAKNGHVRRFVGTDYSRRGTTSDSAPRLVLRFPFARLLRSVPGVSVLYLGDIHAAMQWGCDQNPSQTVPPLT
jgi:hypothetical protein